jgi:hypothetical protein
VIPRRSVATHEVCLQLLVDAWTVEVWEQSVVDLDRVSAALSPASWNGRRHTGRGWSMWCRRSAEEFTWSGAPPRLRQRDRPLFGYVFTGSATSSGRAPRDDRAFRAHRGMTARFARTAG